MTVGKFYFREDNLRKTMRMLFKNLKIHHRKKVIVIKRILIVAIIIYLLANGFPFLMGSSNEHPNKHAVKLPQKPVQTMMVFRHHC